MWSLACLCSCPSVWEALCLPASWSGLWPGTEGFTWAGSITLQMTSVLQEVVLYGSDGVAHPFLPDYTCWLPCAKAEKQSGAGQKVAVHRHLCRSLGETRRQQRLVKSHAVTTMHGTERDYPSCTQFTEPNFLGILLQNRCKILLSVHCSNNSARCKEVEKMPAQANSLHRAQRETWSCTIQRKSCRRAIVTSGLLCSADNLSQFWNIQTLPDTLTK